MAPNLDKPSSLTVPLLRAELAKRGISTTGMLKPELVARLTEALAEAGGGGGGDDVDGDVEMADAPAEAAQAEAEPAGLPKRGAAATKKAPEAASAAAAAAAEEPAKRPRRGGGGSGSGGGGGGGGEQPVAAGAAAAAADEKAPLASASAEVAAAAKATALKERMLAAEEKVAQEHREEAAKEAETGNARAQREALAADAAEAEARSLRAEVQHERGRLSAAEEAEAAAMAAVAERAERRAAERAAAAAAAAAAAKAEEEATAAPASAPSAAAPADAAADDDEDDDDDDEDAPLDSSLQQAEEHLKKKNKRKKLTGAECPYLDTINRSALDFDFAAACSVSLATANVYCCLVCGKFYAGKGSKTPANTHSLDAGHHVFMRIDGGGGGGEVGGGGSEEEDGGGNRGKAYVLPEGYEVDDPSLDPIRAVLAPRFDAPRVAALDRDRRWARSLDGEPFVPGIVGLNSLGGRTDFANAVLQSLLRVSPLRDFFLEPRNYAHAASSPLVCRFGDFVRRAWNDRAFRGHVSPHELMVAVERASGGRFSPGGGGGGGGGGGKGGGGGGAAGGGKNSEFQRSASTDAAAFLVWLLNALHVDLVVPPGPTAPTGGAAARIAAGARSIVTACFQGEVQVTTETATVAGGGGGGGGGTGTGNGNGENGNNETTTTAKSKFLVLALDPPPAPLYKDALEQNIIPQVALATLLSKYDGRTVTDDARAGRRTLEITRLPRFLLLHVRRFARNAFFAEKNPTIVNFPVKGLPLGDLLRYKSRKNVDDPFRYDLAASVAHEGPAAAGNFKAHVQRKADGTWFECCDLRVAETLPQVVALSEAYVQVWEKRAVAKSAAVGGGGGAVPMEEEEEAK